MSDMCGPDKRGDENKAALDAETVEDLEPDTEIDAEVAGGQPCTYAMSHC